MGSHPELLQGSLHRFSLLVLAAVCAVLAALYYFFVHRPVAAASRRHNRIAAPLQLPR